MENAKFKIRSIADFVIYINENCSKAKAFQPPIFLELYQKKSKKLGNVPRLHPVTQFN